MVYTITLCFSSSEYNQTLEIQELAPVSFLASATEISPLLKSFWMEPNCRLLMDVEPIIQYAL